MIRQYVHPIHHTLPLYEVHSERDGVTVAQYHGEDMVDRVYLEGSDGYDLVDKLESVEHSDDMTEMQRDIIMWNMLDAYFYEPTPEYALGVRDRALRGAVGITPFFAG